MSTTEAATLLHDLVTALRALGIHRAVEAIEAEDWTTVDAELAFCGREIREALRCAV